jgi:hypothetical protein
MRFLRLLALVALSGLSVATLAACGGEQQATTVTETVVQQATPAASDSGSASRRSDSSQNDDGSSDSVSSSSASGRIRVPDVVGKDHQLAQDTMQAAGLYNLAEEDATGQGRLLLIDRNWTVVSQSPSAGSKVNEDTTIVLRSKKDGE